MTRPDDISEADWATAGIVIVPLDPERLAQDRPVKPRKPKAERKAIPTRPTQWPKRGFPEGRTMRVKQKTQEIG